MITHKPFLKPGLNGRFILSLQVIVEAPDRPKVSATFIPETAKNLVSPDQATTLYFSEDYQRALARFTRVLVPGWKVGVGTTTAPAKPPAPVHKITRPLKEPVVNQAVAELYHGAPRVVPSPAPAENPGTVQRDKTGNLVVVPTKKSEQAVAQVEDLRITANGGFVEAGTAKGIRQNWDERIQVNRRVHNLATLLNKDSREILDILHDLGETQPTAHLSTLTPQQAEKVALRVLGR